MLLKGLKYNLFVWLFLVSNFCNGDKIVVIKYILFDNCDYVLRSKLFDINLRDNLVGN